MPTFQSNPFHPSTSSSAASLGERIGTTYRRHLANHPFLLFGLPFISVIVASSFLLTPATALRYERHDRKNRAVTHGEAMELGLKGLGDEEVNYNPRRRKVTKGGTTERDEYYVSSFQTVAECWGLPLLMTGLQKLMAKDLDDWEQKRVERWKGEPDGRL
jgi:cytochrome c oxidase assembly protein subunit 16